GIALTLSLVAGPALPAGDPPAEPKAPHPTPAVVALLDDGDRLLGEKKFEEALAAAQRALAAAEGARDDPGRAAAQRMRGRSLEALERAGDAGEAWTQAAALWGHLGAGPEAIEALGRKALGLDRDDAQVAALVEQALGLAKKEMARPLAAASSLSDAASRG